MVTKGFLGCVTLDRGRSQDIVSEPSRFDGLIEDFECITFSRTIGSYHNIDTIVFVTTPNDGMMRITMITLSETQKIGNRKRLKIHKKRVREDDKE